MAAQLDLSLLATIPDRELRASLERLGNAMAEASSGPPPTPPPSSTAKILQFPLFPHDSRPVSNDMARSALFSCVQGKDRRYMALQEGTCDITPFSLLHCRVNSYRLTWRK